MRSSGRLTAVACGAALTVAAAAVPVAAALAATPDGGLNGATSVHVWPRTGGVHHRFAVRFAIPTTTGPYRTDSIVVTGPQHPWCSGSASVALPAETAGHAFRINLGPGAHRRWCPGSYSGTLVQRQQVVCDPGPVVMSSGPVVMNSGPGVMNSGPVAMSSGPGVTDPRRPDVEMCPQLMFAPVVLGRFAFRVVR